MTDICRVKTIEDDLFTVKFIFECNYLMMVDIEVKDKTSIPAIDLENKAAVNQWCHAVWGGFQRMFSHVPERTMAMSVARKTDDRSRSGESILMCPTCNVSLTEKKACCGSSQAVWRCPKCGTGYKAPEKQKMML